MAGGSIRLRRRIQLLILAFFALVALDFLAAVQATAVRDRSSDAVDQRLAPARERVVVLLNALVNQETGQRGFLITGDNADLEPYSTGQAAAAKAFDDLDLILRAYPGQLPGVAAARANVEQWQARVAEPEITARRDLGIERARELVAGESKLKLFDRATISIDDLRQGVNRELTAAEVRRDRARSALITILLVTFIVAFVLLLLARFVIERWINLPLEHLNRSVRTVAGGELDHQIVPEGPPELAELGADVDAMRRRILQELDDADRARDALAKRGLVVLTLRDELAPSEEALPAGWELAARWDPAEGILAGDWYDVIALQGGTTIGLALVDVSGHGAATGVYALRTKQLLLAAMRSGFEPGAAWKWVQEQLGDTGEQFLTGVVVELDTATGLCRYASAGHPEVLLVGAAGAVQLLESTGPILGPFASHWDTEEALLEPGGMLLTYTDGLIEARDARAEEFGLDRLVDLVGAAAKAGAGPDDVADAALAATRTHSVTRHDDDITVLALARR